MGLSVETGIPVITVFIQGLLSFFSPCVLPLVPLYVSYPVSYTHLDVYKRQVLLPPLEIMLQRSVWKR